MIKTSDHRHQPSHDGTISAGFELIVAVGWLQSPIDLCHPNQVPLIFRMGPAWCTDGEKCDHMAVCVPRLGTQYHQEETRLLASPLNCPDGEINFFSPWRDFFATAKYFRLDLPPTNVKTIFRRGKIFDGDIWGGSKQSCFFQWLVLRWCNIPQVICGWQNHF